MAKQISVGKPVNASERWGISFLADNLPDDYQIITNLDLYDERGHPFEIDAIVIGELAVYLIDIKGYKGRLVASKDAWSFESRPVENPLSKINHNSRVLASRCKKYLRRGQHSPWCQGLVFVTGGEGESIYIDNNGHKNLPVYTKNNIIDALTSREYVTSQYQYVLQAYQKELAINSICDFKLIQDKENVIAGYSKESLISTDGDIETWLVKPVSGSFPFRYWMKTVDLTALPENICTSYRDFFKQEYRFLSELADLKCIPAPLLYWDDGENLTIVHSSIEGEKLSQVCLSYDALINSMATIADALLKINALGLSCNKLTDDNLYVTNDGIATISNISGVIETLDEDLLSHESLAFAKTFSACLFEPSGNGDYQPTSELSDNAALLDWFNDVLSGGERSIEELMDNIDANNKTNVDSIEKFVPQVAAVLNRKYKLLECIGRGSTSTVWKASHLVGDYVCSIKLFEEFEGADTLAKYEFEILRSSFHPNIVRIFDLDHIPGGTALYLSSQYLDGNSLDKTELSASKLWMWFKQLLSALQYLHRINIIHKDIKPQNIVIDGDKPYLIDFNLSSFDTPAIGTIKYKDPQVYQKGWGQFSDIYSLVITFLELYLGKHPFSDYDEIPQVDVSIDIPKKIEGLSSSTRSRLSQVINRQVDWTLVTDYLSWFGLENKSDLSLKTEIKNQWHISDGYMTKVLICMLSDMQARSRQVVINNTLKAYDLVGSKSTRGSISASISALKRNNIVVEKGKKIHLSQSFIDSWKLTCAIGE